MSTSHRLLLNEASGNRIGWLTTVSLLSIVYYLASLLLLRTLNESATSIVADAGYFGIGSYVHQTNAAFILLGLGGMVLTTGLYLGVPNEVRWPAGLVLLGIWAAAMVMAGLFPFGMLSVAQATTTGSRALAGLDLLCMVAAASFMVGRLNPGRRWQTLARITSRWAH